MSDQVNELLQLRMSLKAIRDRVNQDFDAINAKLERLLPEPQEPKKKVTDWKKEVASW